MQEGFEKKVLGEECCQCGNVASSNVANGQWGGLAGAEARWDLRAWKPATPSVGGHTECGRARGMFFSRKDAKGTKNGERGMGNGEWGMGDGGFRFPLP